MTIAPQPAIPVSLLTAHPGNVRRDLDLSPEFVASIAANGVLVPLRTTRGADGAFGVIDGHRRLAAAIQAGLADVPANLAEGRAGDEPAQYLDMWNAHRHRNPLTPIEEADALFAAAAAWLKPRGLTLMRGPASFYTNDECGLVVDGFDTPPTLLNPHNPRYYVELVERAGFTKAQDLYQYQSPNPTMPARLTRASHLLAERKRITLRKLDMKRWDEEIERIVRQHLSPLYVSVHATDEQLRRRLVGRQGMPVLPLLKRLTEAGIEIHTQIVLCPGVNDGAELERTVEDLAALRPGIASLAVVPVGLTSMLSSGDVIA